MGNETAVETLRSWARMARNMNKISYAFYLDAIASKGEVAAAALVAETRQLGKDIVYGALSPSATNVDSDGER